MIKRISEYARPKIWCPQEDYHLPGDGISMSITSAFPSSTNEKSEIYHNTGIKRKDGGIFVLHPSMAITTDATCHRNKNVSVPGSRSGRCSRASLQRIPRSVFLNACTRVPFVRISVCAEMQHGCRVKRRLQLRVATATVAVALNIFFQHLWFRRKI
ncbi:Uncharacterized protein DBV15_11424 [Temnothorax longispinosus]|uniref:Uncharacterized protein n=1 Tax=Temnothorax longispinosus TaxID=300112 RepID=A0A4S2L0V6_9HYME|nr:Uncharacterized protein DBV15_11424 [Temnothorax longispinosus]